MTSLVQKTEIQVNDYKSAYQRFPHEITYTFDAEICHFHKTDTFNFFRVPTRILTVTSKTNVKKKEKKKKKKSLAFNAKNYHFRKTDTFNSLRSPTRILTATSKINGKKGKRFGEKQLHKINIKWINALSMKWKKIQPRRDENYPKWLHGIFLRRPLEAIVNVCHLKSMFVYIYACVYMYVCRCAHTHISMHVCLCM